MLAGLVCRQLIWRFSAPPAQTWLTFLTSDLMMVEKSCPGQAVLMWQWTAKMPSRINRHDRDSSLLNCLWHPLDYCQCPLHLYSRVPRWQLTQPASIFFVWNAGSYLHCLSCTSNNCTQTNNMWKWTLKDQRHKTLPMIKGRKPVPSGEISVWEPTLVP